MAVVAATLGGCGQASGGAAPSSPAGACAASQLTAAGRLISEASDQYQATVVLTDHGSACSLDGFPGVQVVNAAGSPQPTTDARVRQTPPGQVAYHPVTLQPGGHAAFDIYGASYNPVANRSCHSMTSAVLVIPPNDRHQMRVGIRLPLCTNHIDVAPVIAGSSDSQPYGGTYG